MKIESKRTRDEAQRRLDKTLKDAQEALDAGQKRINDATKRIQDLQFELFGQDDTDDEWIKHFHEDDETQSLEERRTEL